MPFYSYNVNFEYLSRYDYDEHIGKVLLLPNIEVQWVLENVAPAPEPIFKTSLSLLTLLTIRVATYVENIKKKVTRPTQCNEPTHTENYVVGKLGLPISF